MWRMESIIAFLERLHLSFSIKRICDQNFYYYEFTVAGHDDIIFKSNTMQGLVDMIAKNLFWIEHRIKYETKFK